MPIELIDYLKPDEAEGLADFLVEMNALEESLSTLLAQFYAQPARREEFTAQFLDRMTLGNKLDRARPILQLDESGQRLRGRLKELADVRNAVAHWRPKEVYEGPADDPEPMLVYRRGDLTVKATDLARYAGDARAARITLRSWLNTPADSL